MASYGDRFRKVSAQPVAEANVIRLLSGVYLAMEENHGRPFFRKDCGTHADGLPQVFLYYWDNRDGSEYMGWWFGERVGGVNVWSRSSCDSALPPCSSWRYPWDSESTNEFIVLQLVQSATAIRILVGPSQKRCRPRTSHAPDISAAPLQLQGTAMMCVHTGQARSVPSKVPRLEEKTESPHRRSVEGAYIETESLLDVLQQQKQLILQQQDFIHQQQWSVERREASCRGRPGKRQSRRYSSVPLR